MNLLPGTLAEFYSAATNVQGVVDDMYHIMVELAVIHEQLCGHLARHSQLVEEGETIKDLLSNLPESAALGVDSMVP
ncbi:hypothetical protein B0H14DRAFT_3464218 [Mycena olivaceomarginata]|nr:hypothetical protein B0H14DRAFT_3464218 [Mycena olivaceomarginata]